MQESNSITFEPIVHTSKVSTWEIVVGILLFAGLIYFAIWRSRKQSKNPGSLNLSGK
jgi:uncharacterized membrane protein YgdD (TMEM256/DUF423 family)